MAAKQSASPPDAAATPHGRVLKALAGLPEISEGTYYGYPAFKVGKKFLCRLKDDATLVVTCPLEENEMLMAAAPTIYFETDHYRGWPAVLVRLDVIDDTELRHRLRKAWLSQAPKKLAKQLPEA